MLLYNRRRQKVVRDLKESGKIKPEQFDRKNLEQLGVLLIKFCKNVKSSERVLTNVEQITIIEAESLIGFLDLLLSEKTEHGYLQEYYEKSSFM